MSECSNFPDCRCHYCSAVRAAVLLEVRDHIQSRYDRERIRFRETGEHGDIGVCSALQEALEWFAHGGRFEVPDGE